MGAHADSESHYVTVRKVLKGHLIRLSHDKEEIQARLEKPEKLFQGKSTPPLAERPARQSSARIREALGGETTTDELCPIAAMYLKIELHRGTRSVQGARANAYMINRFFKWRLTERKATDEISILLCQDAPIDFFGNMSSVLRANTLKNHAGAMIALLSMALYEPKFRKLYRLGHAKKSRVQSVLAVWADLKRRQEKRARADQRQKIRAGQLTSVPIKGIFDYLLEFSCKAEKIIERCKNKSALNKTDEAIVNSVVAVILATHGQRLCAAINLRAAEVLNAVGKDGCHVVRISRHKTAKQMGPAAIALRPHHFGVLKALAELRIRLTKERDPTLLPQVGGDVCKTYFRHVNVELARVYPGWTTLTFNLVRKTLETNSYLSGCVQAESSTQVSQYLCHGREITSLFYRFWDDAAVVADASKVESVLVQMLCMDLVRDGVVKLPAHWKGSSDILSGK